MREDVSLTKSLDDVGDVFVNFFVDLFGSHVDTLDLDHSVLSIGPLIEPAAHDGLLAPITDKEIKDALFDIGDDKALGPDGFSSAFFKANWSIVEKDMVRVIKEFFRTGKMLK
ncbi:unnamed protein product [Cuscuta epithymum]|uniref:Uncharacterized protein n=1 Tax=Cuscuta epithymum TaxID=186058 RepID=A0AAV0BX85_9ASTE|nr:unnamed protein product [Cuscuta epithymum]